MVKSFRLLAVSMMGVALGSSSTVWAQTASEAVSENVALPYPTKAMPKPTDLGALSARPETTPISITIALKLPKMEEAESLLKSINTPGDPQFHKFLTADEFTARFAPTDTDVARVVASLAQYGLSAQRKGATALTVTGRSTDFERAFSVSLHSYDVAAQGNVRGYSFYAPLSRPTIPAEISSSVAAVIGLDTRPKFHPMHKTAPQLLSRVKSKASEGNQPGFWTVTDFANYYDVAPLYKHVYGTGRTIGIMTLASMHKSDAYAYWSALGLSVDPTRITSIAVDGGPGVASDASGSDETTLDVEQSGGIARHAKIIVYEAPNTDQGFVDVFAAAIEANAAQSLSISWGEWEWYNNLENSPVTDPIGGTTVTTTAAVHQLLVRAAIQGQTVFAAAGDAGAYDVNDPTECPLPDCSATLSVDYPASDPAITAAGGTTLAGLQQYCLNEACTEIYNVTVKHERAWSWDYLNGLCTKLGLDPLACGIFPAGGGGGVSISFAIPSYQIFLPAVQKSQPNQFFIIDGELNYALPPHYAGRNVPDISLNADPDTGYVIYYTSDVSGFGVQPFWGGTSFVAPQLAGLSALLGEDLGNKRLGLLNYPLYSLALSGQAYAKPNAPINAVPYGDNEFYYGSDGYNPAVGLGTLDVANFEKALTNLY
jgi:kumamolisin